MSRYEQHNQSNRCRVCDGPLESPVQIVCNECNRRDTEEMEREIELYEAFLADEESGYKEQGGGKA